MERIDQTSHPPLNPLDLDLRSDVTSNSPVNLYHNDWWFVNDEIIGDFTPREIAVTRADFTDFIEDFGTLSENLAEGWPFDTLEEIVDREQFYYPLNYSPDSYDEAMTEYIDAADDFYGILPDEVDYEDPQDFLKRVDDGSDYGAE